MDKITCPHCGTTYEPVIQAGRNVKRYCSQRCQDRAKEQRKRAKRLAERMDKAGRKIPCLVCDSVFERSRADNVYCSRRCYFRAYYLTNPDKHSSGNGFTGHKQRAEHYGVAYEPINHLEIFERDGYICQLCHLPIDRAAKWPEPLSSSLDHVIPLSKGGNHWKSNVQCAHLLCNMRKGARVE
jgi:5-methylcytosine-specific restriction endonuclease McrA